MGITCSYQATQAGFQKAGYNKDESDELFRRSIQLASAARDEFWELHLEEVSRFPSLTVYQQSLYHIQCLAEGRLAASREKRPSENTSLGLSASFAGPQSWTSILLGPGITSGLVRA